MKRSMIQGLVAMAVVMSAAGTVLANSVTEIVNAYSTDVWVVSVRASVPVTIVVDGDDDTDLDIEVLTADGVRVAYDFRYARDARVSWTPGQSGTVRVRVINRGDVWNQYDLDVFGARLR